ncbi:MAG: type II secretion system GspH family protein [Gammaproteobacteria bacterium]|nr:type II secretion system GspH family protein [Gammaproteobacteria bacterium]
MYKQRLVRVKGFTLIELLVVMSIIATLLTIAVPYYFSNLVRSKEIVLKQDLLVMRKAIDDFLGDHGRHPQDLSELVERKYIKEIPIDPLTKLSTTWETDTSEAGDGIQNVRSGAKGLGRDETAYAQW